MTGVRIYRRNPDAPVGDEWDLQAERPGRCSRCRPGVVRLTPARTPAPAAEGVSEVWSHYQHLHPRARVLDAKTEGLIAARLQEGYTAAEINAAVDAQHADPFYRGKNDRGKAYLGLELVVRDGARVRYFLESKPASTTKYV